MIEVYCLVNSAVKKISFNEINKYKNKHKIWIDVISISKEESEKLRRTFDLHPVTSEDLHKSRTRTKVEEFRKYLLCIFYSMSLKRKVTFTEQDFILGENFLITNHKKEYSYYQELKKDKERLFEFLQKGPDFLMCNFLNDIVETYFPIVAKIDEEIEELEEKSIHTPNKKVLTRIFKLKRLIIAIKKNTFSQRDKIAELGKEEFKLIREKTMPYMRDVYDHSIRVYDLIDSSRDAIANTYDVYMSSITNNTNQVMKLLSIIATITLPLGVIAGIYGTNFRNLPGAENPVGFWIMIGAMLIITITMVVMFKVKEWF